MIPTNRQFNARGAIYLCVNVCVFLILNFIAGALGRGDGGDWVGIAGVIVWAQIMLHTIWCVLAPISFVPRILIGAVIAVLLAGAMAVGVLSDDPDMSSKLLPMINGVLYLPLFAIALQLPLWFARYFFSWRIVHESKETIAQPTRIREILAGTTFVALSIASVRVAIIYQVQITDSFFWLAYAFFFMPILLLSIPIYGMLIILPTVTIIFRTNGLLRAVALYALFVLVIFVLTSGGHLARVPTIKTFVGQILRIGSLYGCVGSALFAARILGYRLLWGKGPTPADVNGTPSRDPALATQQGEP